jgi:hypothetical protein
MAAGNLLGAAETVCRCNPAMHVACHGIAGGTVIIDSEIAALVLAISRAQHQNRAKSRYRRPGGFGPRYRRTGGIQVPSPPPHPHDFKFSTWVGSNAHSSCLRTRNGLLADLSSLPSRFPVLRPAPASPLPTPPHTPTWPSLHEEQECDSPRRTCVQQGTCVQSW